ncbi:unnamed protein product [Auanema sp. JU1783]|nr:unnamed protein product [Auanema sp. JU1783]
MQNDWKKSANEIVLCEDDEGRLYHRENFGNKEIYCKKKLVRAKYLNSVNTTGWAFLEVEVLKKASLDLQGYVAGYLEGIISKDLIDLHIQNTVDGYCDGAEEYCENLNNFLLENVQWMLEQIKNYPDDEYWQQVSLTLHQVFGLVDGYDGVLNQQLSIKNLVAHPIYLIQLAGDLEDLSEKFNKPSNPTRLKTGHGRCSALVKLLPDFSDIYFSHVTWSSYSSLLRMQKKYTFRSNNPGNSYSFSSYPGSVTSTDDFILTSAKLAIFETTIGNYDKRLYDFTTPQTVLTFIRSQIAHRTASSGTEWAHAFAKHNSGTYNNQWVILDYKNFRRYDSNQRSHGLLHVLEQMPHHIVHSDMTSQLYNTTYWPSYNTPYFPQIFKWSGAPAMVDRYGDWYSYDKTPRALIFKRDHSKVKDMRTMIKLMRSNNYTEDPLSACDCEPPYSGENAISCRSELNDPDGVYPFPALGYRDHGATDMKVTNSYLINKLAFTAIAGPTHDPTPVFDWRTISIKDKVPHNGQPDVWDFKPVTFKWK